MEPSLPHGRPFLVDDPESRILVVDDHADLATAMALALRYEGYVTATAFTGHQAIAMARTFLPHVVILDIDLPDCDGYEVARVLRLEFQFDPLIIIAISGRERNPAIPTGPSAFINRYMIKPIELEVLFGSLRDANRKRCEKSAD